MVTLSRCNVPAHQTDALPNFIYNYTTPQILTISEAKKTKTQKQKSSAYRASNNTILTGSFHPKLSLFAAKQIHRFLSSGEAHFAINTIRI